MLHSEKSQAPAVNEQKMTSLEISEITGKRHSDLLRSIKNQEVAWEKVTERKFAFSEYTDSTGRKLPMYELSKAESLYIATKFNDEARAKLVLRWYELEKQNTTSQQKAIEDKPIQYPEKTVISVRMGEMSNQIYVQNGVLYAKLSPIMKFLGYLNNSGGSYIERVGKHNCISVMLGKSPAWFVNMEAVTELINSSKMTIPHKTIETIYRDLFGVNNHRDQNGYTYMFTDSEMLYIIKQINDAPINKDLVIKLLFKGNK